MIPRNGVSFFEITANGTGPVSLLLKGPSGGEHRGRFAIPPVDRFVSTVAFRGYFSSSHDPTFMQMFAQWYVWDPTAEVLVGASQDAVGNVRQLVVGEYIEIQEEIVAPEGMTHWAPRFVFTSSEPSGEDGGGPIPANEKIYFDSLYVPENGKSLAGQLYLDGNQPYGQWEGEPNRSTSVFRSDVPIPDDGVFDPAVDLPPDPNMTHPADSLVV